MGLACLGGEDPLAKSFLGHLLEGIPEPGGKGQHPGFLPLCASYRVGSLVGIEPFPAHP